jgi:threonine/homoserine/homoserine lactone efflux protein
MYFVIAAITFGLVAGLKPGPLGVFVIHQTMSKGYFQGFLSSLAPILTDGPIILLALLLTLQVNDLNWFVSLISILGAVYLTNISYKIFTAPGSVAPYDRGI